MRRIVYLSLLVIIFTQSCNNGMDSILLYFGDSERIKRIEYTPTDTIGKGISDFTYDEYNRLKSFNSSFEGAMGKADYLYNYSYGKNKIFIKGWMKVYPASELVPPTESDVDIELKLDSKGRIIKKIDRQHSYNALPVIDDFIWKKDKLVKIERHIEGISKQHFSETLEQYYEGHNITMKIVKTKSIGDENIVESTDTIKYIYNLEQVDMQAAIYRLTSFTLGNIEQFAAYSVNAYTSKNESKYMIAKERSTNIMIQEIISETNTNIRLSYNQSGQYESSEDDSYSNTLIQYPNDSSVQYPYSSRGRSIFIY